jgi:oxygen-independent coproporphyrinogen-3 oxidase
VEAGVTRISINPQSMEDCVLEVIGRGHTSADIFEAVALVRSQGFPVLNMDLIAGLPGDAEEGFARTLRQVLDFGAENITIHTLSRKKGTKITLDHTQAPDAKAVSNMLDHAQSAFAQGEYVPYYLYLQKFTAGGFENVGWCKPQTESLYNIAIMEELCSILSLGGGASTKLVAPKSGHIVRIFNPKYPYEYVEGIDKILAGKQEITKFYAQEEF